MFLIRVIAITQLIRYLLAMQEIIYPQGYIKLLIVLQVIIQRHEGRKKEDHKFKIIICYTTNLKTAWDS